jgi:signal transduction histidine kinase
MIEPRPHGRNRKNSELAFIIVVIASFIVALTSGPLVDNLDRSFFIALGLGIIYTLIGIFGSRQVESRRLGWLTALYFVVEISLGALIIYLTKGNAWLMLMPIVGSAVEYLSRPLAVVVCTLVVLAMLGPFALRFGWGVALAWSTPFIAAVVFVAVFTTAMVSEANARVQLSRANQKLREYAAQAEELAVAQERNRLAREIHDGLGHYLTAINIQLKAAQAMSVQDPSAAQTALQNAQTLTGEALSDVRRSISALRADPSTNRPLAETLNLLLAETRAADLRANLEVAGTPRPLAQQVEFTLYRVAQESLTNVRKHANAGKVDLRLDYLERAVRLSVEDDGVGSGDASGGFGLVGLQERVNLLNGSLRVETAPGSGFRLSVEIPTG